MANKSTEKVYEVSFHLIPTIEQDAIPQVFERVKQVVVDAGGEVLTEEVPVLRDLAYTIRHTVRQSDGSYNRYDEAYFGSIKFKSAQDRVQPVEQTFLQDEQVLRFLLLETVAEDTRIGEVLPSDEVAADEAEADDSEVSAADEQEEGESGIAEQPNEGGENKG